MILSAETPEGASPGSNAGFLDDAMRAVQAAVEQKFLFRKIGLPFDYASSPDDFPSKAFATAKEARAQQPNPAGLGAGFHFSCRNHALLFDAYLLRIESGIETPGDEAILDRLIGGLIRLATIAPKSFLVGGLAADGRGFYGQPRRENHVAWAFAVTRGLFTAAIAPESQEKFRSIAGKWIDRIRREKYRLNSVDGKQVPGGDISRPEPDSGPFLLAMLLTAARAAGDEKDVQAYEAMAEEESRARMQAFDAGDDMDGLLWRQAAWQLIASGDPNPGRREVAAQRLREYALAAAVHVGDIAKWDPGMNDVAVDFNWREFPKVPLQDSPYGFQPPESWRRLENEAMMERGLSAAYALLLAGDKGLAEDWSGQIAECLRATPWDSFVSLNAPARALAVHARGVELGLWDEGLFDSRRETPFSEVSIAAKYLEADYDDMNPEKAGHVSPPPAPSRPEGAGGGNRRRRRKKRK